MKCGLTLVVAMMLLVFGTFEANAARFIDINRNEPAVIQVPLPPAALLFASGLLGLWLISRVGTMVRRQGRKARASSDQQPHQYSESIKRYDPAQYQDVADSQSVRILNVRVDRRSLETLTQEGLQAINGKQSSVIFSCANPHSLMVARKDPVFHSALCDSTQVVADGVGVVLLAKAVGIPALPRITGTDYFHHVMAALVQRGGGRVFFFGSTQYVLDRIAERFAREYPTLTLCGLHSPPFGEWSETENQRMVEMINAAKPDVLWVSMTAPKQEKWVHRSRALLRVPLIGSIGAVFDFYAETKPRAPTWMSRVGIEWLYRLLREPQRMWRRNFISMPIFIGLMVWEHGVKLHSADLHSAK